jgi:hypothetical protein
VPAGVQQTVVVQMSYGLVPIGWVQSALKVPGDAPHQRDGAPRAWIRFDEQVAEGARDLRPGDEIVVLTWLHLSRRDELSTRGWPRAHVCIVKTVPSPVIACRRRVSRLAGMDRPKRRNMVLDLRVMDDKIRLWLGAEDLDEDDRQALETVRDLISRPG